eukprot:15106193-Alexandrium_andersonii.AAC.1
MLVPLGLARLGHAGLVERIVHGQRALPDPLARLWGRVRLLLLDEVREALELDQPDLALVLHHDG